MNHDRDQEIAELKELNASMAGQLRVMEAERDEAKKTLSSLMTWASEIAERGKHGGDWRMDAEVLVTWLKQRT